MPEIVNVYFMVECWNPAAESISGEGYWYKLQNGDMPYPFRTVDKEEANKRMVQLGQWGHRCRLIQVTEEVIRGG